jgi:folate-dependent phosphoribosylglycinamide formyltransferase PurN
MPRGGIQEELRAHLPEFNPLVPVNSPADELGVTLASHTLPAGRPAFRELLNSIQDIGTDESGTTLRGLDFMSLEMPAPTRPLRVAFLTSVRDVGKIERVGAQLKNEPGRRLIGTIEATLRALQETDLGNFIEVVGIITDDMPSDLKSSSFSPAPTGGSNWIFPRSLRNARGDLAVDLTRNIPSLFRALPQKSLSDRRLAKLEFEAKVFDFFDECRADVIVSDHFLCKVEYLIDPHHFGLYGRVLNTHPGITRPDSPYCCRGWLTYELAISNAKASAPHLGLTGASFHVISADIDGGPVLCDGALTQVYPSDTIRSLINRIYPTSKNPVFLSGIKHYSSNFWPLIDTSPR